jgi:hypothetical protein
VIQDAISPATSATDAVHVAAPMPPETVPVTAISTPLANPTSQPTADRQACQAGVAKKRSSKRAKK